MINCTIVSEHLGAFIDNQLSSPERKKVSAHLQKCPNCRRECNYHLATRNAVSNKMKPGQAPFRLKLSITSNSGSAMYRQPTDHDEPLIPLGFCDDAVPPGTHICLFYENDRERDHMISEYLNAGLRGGERCYCVMWDEKPSSWIKRLSDKGHDVGPVIDKEQLHVLESHALYFPDGEFIPEDVIERVRDTATDSARAGYHKQRLFGDFWWVKDRPHLLDHVVEYERQFDKNYFADNQGIVTCLYNLRLFNDKFVEKILNVHPYYIFQGKFKRNPSYACT